MTLKASGNISCCSNSNYVCAQTQQYCNHYCTLMIIMVLPIIFQSCNMETYIKKYCLLDTEQGRKILIYELWNPAAAAAGSSQFFLKVKPELISYLICLMVIYYYWGGSGAVIVIVIISTHAPSNYFWLHHGRVSMRYNNSIHHHVFYFLVMFIQE